MFYPPLNQPFRSVAHLLTENTDKFIPFLNMEGVLTKLRMWNFTVPGPHDSTLKKNQDVYPCELVSFSSSR